MKTELWQENYEGFKLKKTVKFVFVKFDELLFEPGLSDHRSEVISIKVEIDTKPPC
jgi:hypothetical protein